MEVNGKGHWSIRGPWLPSHTTRTRQTPQQRIHAIERQLVAVAQTQRKSGDIKLEEEKWRETDQNVGRAPFEGSHCARGGGWGVGGGGQVGTQQLSLRACLYPTGGP